MKQPTVGDVTIIANDQEENPLLQEREDFFPYQRLRSEHFMPAIEWLKELVETRVLQVEECSDPPTWQNTMTVLEECFEMIHRLWAPIKHLQQVNFNPKWQVSYEEAQRIMVALVLKIKQSKATYEKLCALQNSESLLLSSSTHHRAWEHTLKEYRLAGAGLTAAEKKEWEDVEQKIHSLAARFSQNIIMARKNYQLIIKDAEKLSGVPESTLARLSAHYARIIKKPSTPKKGPWLITQDGSHHVVSIYAHSADLRERIYIDSHRLNSEGEYGNKDIIKEILALRAKQAQLLGYPHYASVSLESKMASSISEVQHTLDDFAAACVPAAQAHMKELQSFKESKDLGGDLKPWDRAYYANLLKKQQYHIDEKLIREHLPYSQVLQGLFDLIKKLFSIEMRSVDVSPTCTWDSHVQCYAVCDTAAREPRAWIFLDPYARAGSKRGGAWMLPFRRHRMDSSGKRQLPISYVMCNFGTAKEGKETLLTWKDMRSLFHEFGHALQQVLSTVETGLISELTSMETDAVEFPSQFMEQWCSHKPTVLSFARHYQSGELLSEDMFERIQKANNFGKAGFYLMQIALSKVDLELHCREISSVDEIFELYQKILNDTVFSASTPYSYSALTLCSASHLFAHNFYAAGYFGYLSSQIMSADTFALFKQREAEGVEALRQLGQHFREKVLAVAGSVHPREAYRSFAGRDPHFDALLMQLNLATVAK